MIVKKLPKQVRGMTTALFVSDEERDALCALFAKQSPERLQGVLFKDGKGWALTGVYMVLKDAGGEENAGKKQIAGRLYKP